MPLIHFRTRQRRAHKMSNQTYTITFEWDELREVLAAIGSRRDDLLDRVELNHSPQFNENFKHMAVLLDTADTKIQAALNEGER